MSDDRPVVDAAEEDVTDRWAFNTAGRLSLSDPLDPDACRVDPDLLERVAGMLVEDGDDYRPLIVDFSTKRDDFTRPTLAFVNDDDRTDVVVICPLLDPEDARL